MAENPNFNYDDSMEFADFAQPTHPPENAMAQIETTAGAGEQGDSSDEEFCLGPPDRPLERLCPEALQSTDVTEFFPSFRRGDTLRFYELFKPVHRPPRYWARKPKKRQRTLSGMSLHDEAQTSAVKLEDVAPRVENDEDVLMRCSEADMLKMRQEKIRKGLLIDLSSPLSLQLFGTGDQMGEECISQIAPWRYGPASLWYDRIGVPPDAKSVNYGFKVDPAKKHERNKGGEIENPLFTIPEDTFNMAAHYRWEDDIIWTPEQAKEIEQRYENDKSRLARAGWVPHGDVRTMAQFYAKYKDTLPGINTGALLDILNPKNPPGEGAPKPRLIYPIFPPESSDLISGKWEDKIIWDAEHMPELPEPELVLPAAGDDFANLQLPESGESGAEDEEEPPPAGTGTTPSSPVKGQNRMAKKRSRLLLKTGVRGLGTALDDLDAEASNPLSGAKNIFNLSNDEFYEGLAAASKALGGRSVAVGVLQHSTPAAELRPIFFPTCLSLTKLRQYHRPTLKRYPNQQNKEGSSEPNKATTVTSLTQRIKEQAELREAERQRSGGGQVFFMRHVSDLSGRDGDVCLVEYSEQYPPLVSQTGMASKIINYYKRKPEKDRDVPECKFGQLALATTGMFLGNIQPGQLLQSLCNNMFRAPIYSHELPKTDFLLIRTRRKLFIRRVDDVFLAGQQVPLVEVPPPNSKSAFNFAKDFLLYHIFRMFLRSTENPSRVRMEDVKKAFPQHTEATIRKRLKSIADFKRAGGSDACYWILRPEVRLPSEEELHDMVSPEQFCANFSTLAGEVRLKDAGYGDRAFLAIDEDNADDLQSKMEDEVKAAPWNTTGALISAMKGKCVLEVHGVADPTGCGQGFSYVRLPAKPPKPDEKPPEKAASGPLTSPQAGPSKDADGANAANKRSVIGTDSDLRKLHVKDARKILQNFGVPEAEIKKLTRWEMIDVIRTMSTEQARAGIDTSFSSKFARSGRFSVHEYHRNFRKECQKVFDLQNRVLALTDPLSSEESGASGDEDEGGKQQKKLTEVEQIGRSVETILRGRGINIQSSAGNLAPKSSTKQPEQKEKQRILQITRTFRTPDGQSYDRVEIVRRPALVDAYVRIRTAPGGDEVVRDLASVILGDGKAKKAPNKERDTDKPPAKRGRPAKPRPEGEVPKVKGQRGRKRRIIADIRENLLGGGGASSSENPGVGPDGGAQSMEPLIGPDGIPRPRIRIKPMPNMNKFKCSACGAVGHVRSNRNCPLFGKSGAESATSLAEGDKSLTFNTSGDPDAPSTSQDLMAPTVASGGETLIKVEETKLKVARKLVDHYFEQMKRKSQLKIRPKKWSKLGLAKTWRTPNREEEKAKEAAEHRNEGGETEQVEDVEMHAVGEDQQPEQQQSEQQQCELFEEDEHPPEESGGETSANDPGKFKFKFIFGSSKPSSRRGSTVPGGSSSAEPTASSSGGAVNEYAKQYKGSHRRIVDPLLALNTVFEKIVNPLRTNPVYEAFSLPVDIKRVPDYFTVVSRPMDLATMRKRCVDKVYGSRSDFLEDTLLIVTNSRYYNGEAHPLTAIAQQLYEVVIGEVSTRDAELVPLEKAANPLIEDDFRAFSFILSGVIDEVKRVEGSWPFHDPVNRKKVKDYYDVVKTPMDLSTLSKKLQAGYYRRVSEFLCDLSLLQSNSILYNGPDHPLTTIANRMMEVAGEQLSRFADRLSECERNIPLPSTNLSDIDPQRAMIGDDAESVATETTFSDFFSASMAAGGAAGPPNAGSALAAFIGHQHTIVQGGEERAPDSAASWNANTTAGLEDDLNMSSSSSSSEEEGEIHDEADDVDMA